MVTCPFRLEDHAEEVLALMKKYASVPMSLADACLVRMTEVMAQPVLLTTDSDFRIYRRHGRQVVPCVLPD
jgi:predicted nucleic acid-binding protein